MSKLKEYTLKATIPTGNYANIQPEITVEADSIEEAQKTTLPHIKSMFSQFSDQPLKETGVAMKVKSFNEDYEIDFDPIAHSYTFNGEPLMSASGFVKKYTKEFDKLGISKKCETSWEVPQDTILSLWEGNGTASADFGTAIHAVLEHYFKYKAVGLQIMEKSSKKTENAALPNHPFLKRLILELEEIKQDGEGHQEILVSNVERSYCGLVDDLLILDAKKKVCRVRDYKITYDVDKPGDKLLEPFNELSPTKLSKYQLQLSFYANLLEMSGWQVDGLDIFNYDDEWTHHSLEVLKVIE